jgi:hypothetical protein
VIEAQADSLSKLLGKLRSRLQAAKHASVGDLTAVQTLLLSAESLLMQLLLCGDE